MFITRTSDGSWGGCCCSGWSSPKSHKLTLYASVCVLASVQLSGERSWPCVVGFPLTRWERNCIDHSTITMPQARPGYLKMKLARVLGIMRFSENAPAASAFVSRFLPPVSACWVVFHLCLLALVFRGQSSEINILIPVLHLSGAGTWLRGFYSKQLVLSEPYKNQIF